MERNKKIEELRLLEEQFEEVDHKVTAAQDHIDRLAESLGTGDAEVAVVKQELITEEIAQSQRALRELNSQIRAEEAARSALLRQGLTPAQVGAGGLSGLTGGVFGPPGLNGAPAAGVTPGTTNAGLTLQQELMYVQQQIARFESQLRDPNHRDVRRLRERESTLRAMLSGSADPTGTVVPLSRLEWLQQQKSALEVDLERQTQHLETLNKGMIELEKEKRKIEQDITLRDTLQEQKYQRRIELDAPNRITVVQDANIPEQPQMKKKVQLSLLSGLATLGCIVCGFTLFEWFSHRVGAASDISGQVGLRVIGTIPSPDRGGLLGLGLFAGKVDHDEWNRAVTESMDVVRTFLMRHIDPSRPASVLITSASANEGKTTLSCQLAASLARTGKRVALVDCDFRRPSAHELLGGAPGPGLSEWLRGEVSFDEIRQTTQADGLTFIPAGRVDQRVLQLLSIDGGRSLIQQLKSRFDFVIIDTSPLLFVAEPSMIAQNADIVLLATRKDYSRVPYVLQARDSLRSLQVPLLGSIMVGADSDFQRQTYGYQQEVVRMTSGT
jgi:capsular exopolysaccharide synthesis family protein